MFRYQFSSRTKKTEIVAEFDLVHVLNLRDDGNAYNQSLDKVIDRLDKSSLMGTSDDMKDDQQIRQLHGAITQEKWTYFAI